MKVKVKEILCRDILRDIENERIFLIKCYDNDQLFITEACDEYFDYELTKEKCLELAKVFFDLAKCFEDFDHQTEKGVNNEQRDGD